jgi:hypothetical protein
MEVHVGGAWRPITSGEVYLNGSWRTLKSAEAYAAGAWRTVANFTVAGGGAVTGGQITSLTASPDYLSKVGTSATITSNPTTATVSGGHSPYTYAWSIVSGDGQATYAIDAPTLATTTISASNLALDVTATVTVHCTVTDSLGSTAVSNTVEASFTRTSTF